MQEQLKNIENIALEELKLAKDSTTVENIRVKYLGKKGELTTILRSMGGLSKEERPIMGKLVNEVKATLEAKLEEVLTQIKIKEKNEKLANEVIDISIPGTKNLVGKRHPLELTLDSMKEIFVSMGFTIEEGPEVEKDYYNFEALNIPKNHPARSEQDTFYINDNIVVITYKKDANNLEKLIDLLKDNNVSYNSIFSERPTLNDVFLELTGKDLRD